MVGSYGNHLEPLKTNPFNLRTEGAEMKLTKVLMVFILAAAGFLSSCEKEEETHMANVEFTSVTTGDVDGDVTGNGGSSSKTYTWQNTSSKAEYNMDITATKGGSFQLLMKDANGQLVLDKTLVAGDSEDSKSGMTSTGAPGAWTVTVILTNFNGDGSFSISKDM
ncbi:hypothetical protein GCM10027443_33220 [Pontibacter brevis]